MQPLNTTKKRKYIMKNEKSETKVPSIAKIGLVHLKSASQITQGINHVGNESIPVTWRWG